MRFAKLMNDLVINRIELTKLQINTMFLNHLQPECKRFVTWVKQSKDLHTVSYDQLFAYLKQNQDDTNEIRAERATRSHDPLALVTSTYNAPSPYTNPAPSQLSHIVNIKLAYLLLFLSLAKLPNSLLSPIDGWMPFDEIRFPKPSKHEERMKDCREYKSFLDSGRVRKKKKNDNSFGNQSMNNVMKMDSANLEHVESFAIDQEGVVQEGSTCTLAGNSTNIPNVSMTDSAATNSGPTNGMTVSIDKTSGSISGITDSTANMSGLTSILTQPTTNTSGLDLLAENKSFTATDNSTLIRLGPTSYAKLVTGESSRKSEFLHFNCIDMVKNLNNPRQATRDVLVGPKVCFKSTKQIYKPVSNKNDASTSGKKKQAKVSRQEASNSNPVDALNSIENEDDLGTNGRGEFKADWEGVYKCDAW
ncbi:hypothetical protein Tco_0025901 [Tanacetum coccineum]